MALSGSVNYSVNRDEMISLAYEDIGAIRTGGTPNADEITYAAKKLNIMLKAWMAYELNLWVIKQAILIPAKGQQSYTLGPNGDHCSLTMYKTEIRTAGVATDTTLEVDSTTNMTGSDAIGVVTDDGTIHWTTISSVTDSDTVELTSGLDSAAAVDNHVYWYTSKIDRPHELLEVYRREYDTNVDVEITKLSRMDFDNLSDKDTEGTPVNYYYDPQLTDSVLYNWSTADTTFASNSVFMLKIKKPFDDMDASTDDFEFPQEWYEAILTGLKSRIAKHAGVNQSDRLELKQEAMDALELALDADTEGGSIFFTPC